MANTTSDKYENAQTIPRSARVVSIQRAETGATINIFFYVFRFEFLSLSLSVALRTTVEIEMVCHAETVPGCR